MKLESRKLEELVPYVRNSRTHSDAQIAQIAGSIREFGFTNPILIDGQNGIIAGHGRLLAARKLGLTEVPTIVLDHLTETQKRALIIADNQLALNAGWDLEQLKLEIMELDSKDFDLNLLGFDDNFLKGFQEPGAGLTDEDDVPEVPQNIHNVQRGQIWQLGNHRLMCGDSTSKEDVEKLMNGEKADMVFTSPPYNVGKNGFEEKGKYENDDDLKEDFAGFLKKISERAREISKYSFINMQMLSKNKIAVIDWLYSQKEFFVDTFSCSKTTKIPAMEKNVLNSDFEFVFVFGESNRTRHINLGKEFQGNVTNSPPMKRNTNTNKDHRAGFDVLFPQWFIENLTNQGAFIVDLFMGTGTTYIACEKTNRKCFGMELDPHYCSVIIERFQKYSGKKAVRL